MVIAIVQCRLGSQRFPQKALALLNNKPIIRHVVERALQIEGVDRVIVAVPSFAEAVTITNTVDPDDRLGVFFAQVDESDVLSRFVAALRDYPECDTVMRVTADCPLLQPGVCARVLDTYWGTDCEYVWLDTHAGDWPDGVDCEVFSVEALRSADQHATGSDREHVTSWIRRTYPIVELEPDEAYDHWPKVSIDTEMDLKRVEVFVA